MVFKRTDEDAYFVASNSAKGFFSYYHECFDASRIRHLYAIKGGPGTGKSRFLREVATRGVTEGYRAEYIYCSSDADSLDGVILSRGKDECIALLDATAPHVYEPRLVGAREDLVNLGAFWDIAALTARYEEIVRLDEAKKAAYRRAYRYLLSMGEMIAIKDALVAPYIDQDAILRAANKLMRSIPEGEVYQAFPALTHSIGMKGEVILDSYFRRAKVLYRIEDCKGSGRYLLAALWEQAKEKRLRVRLSYDPICPDRLDGLFLMDHGVAFQIFGIEERGDADKKLSMRRFVAVSRMKAVRGEVNYAEGMRRAMLQGAIESLSLANEAHFALEEIYMSTMDFAAKEEFTKKFCNELFDLQK